MNTSIVKIAFILFIFSAVSGYSLDNADSKKSSISQISTNSKKQAPRQFFRAIKAEKLNQKGQMDSSTKKMMKRRNGTWFQRWYNRNF